MALFVYALDPDDDSSAEVLGDISRYSFPTIAAVLLVITIISFNRNSCVFALWHLVTYIQFVRLIPLIDVSPPSFYDAFFRGFFRSIDQLSFFDPDSDLSDERFRAIGINSYSFLGNTDDIFFIWLGCGLITLFCVCFGYQKMQIKFNLIIRSSLILYLDLIFFSCLLYTSPSPRDS